MSEMIERVARALGRSPYTTWEQCAESFREEKRRQARDAIEAMREPTDDMVAAGQAAQARFDSRFERNNADEIFEAMVDQALIELSPLRPAGSADRYGVPRASE